MTTPEIAKLDAAAFNAQGAARDRVFLPESIFDGTVNTDAMHQVVKAYLANQRQGTHSTKTRGLVTGGNQKPWRQKGTGRARQGSTRAPNWPGGGIVFGPMPRGYTQAVPRKVRLLARKSAFNARAREDALVVIEELEFQTPKTSRIRELLNKLDVVQRNVLILTNGLKKNVYLSGRNIENLLVLPFEDVSTYHLLWSHVVLVEGAALGQTLEAAPARESSRKRPASRAEPAAEVAADEQGSGARPAARKRGSAAGKSSGARKSGAKSAPSRARKAATKRSASPARKTAAKKTAAKRAAKPRRKER
jgi:large subunit ribosomal protein L4